MRFRATAEELIGKAWDRVRSRLLNGIDRLGGAGAAGEGGEPAPTSGRAPATGIAIVGCGFVADFYGAALRLHPELRLVGVADRDLDRSARFARRHGCRVYPSLEALLDDPAVELVANLTNPDSHFVVSRQCLRAGRHVYSEKPLAMRLEEAQELVELAEANGLALSGAPCSVLSESAQALCHAIAAGAVGTVRLVYAELDDGAIHQMQPDEWQSPDGTPWPWRDEFTIGCTLEHAGYHLTWLAALFGPVRSVTAFADCLVPDKHPDLPPELCAADFSVACLQFRSGVVARLTCSTVAPHDHSLRVIGDAGVLTVDECWHYGAPLRIRRFSGLSHRADSYTWLRRHAWTRLLFGLDGRKSVYSPRTRWRRRISRHEMDYALGIAELAAAVRERRPCRLPASLLLHVNEVVLAIHAARTGTGPVPIRTTFAAPGTVAVPGQSIPL